MNAPFPYTPAGGQQMTPFGNPPVLGPQIPGTTGGMPAQPGLSVAHNPMAQELQSKGRGEDTMLVHMTPGEVGGLQQLAMASGGSLTINPETGLPEAGWLGKLLPTLIGTALAATGIGAPLAAGIVGLGQTALTGDINKGLMAGLGAFGGASLAGAAGIGSSISNNAFGVLGSKAGVLGANMGAGAAAAGAGLPGAATNLAPGMVSGGAAGSVPGAVPGLSTASGGFNLPGADLISKVPAAALKGAASLPIPGDMLAEQLASQAVPAVGGAASSAAGQAAQAGAKGFFGKFGEAASQGLGGKMAKYAPYAAGLGLLGNVSEAMTPEYKLPQEENKSVYEGPYQFPERRLQPRESGPGGEIVFFDKVNPYPGFLTKDGKLPKGYAEGGETSGGVGSLPMDPSMSRMLASYTDRFRTSPGAITAQNGYPGPSFRDKVLGKGEADFGFKKSSAITPPAANQPGSNEASPTAAFSPNASATATNGQMGGTSIPNFVEGVQGQLLQRDGFAVPPPNMDINPQLKGFNIDAAKVNGQGMMPNFKLEDLRIEPIHNPNVGFSDGLNGTGGSMGRGLGGFDTFGQYNPFGSSGGASSVGSGLDAKYGGGNYNFLDDDYYEEYARGGEVNMKDGSFVVDARTVSELGNGSSNAGIERLSGLGGQPVRGNGDGVSDSVRARIGGKQEARVARDEVIFSPEAVARLGGGNHSKGTQKLYAMMEKAHKARKQAKRGQDTGVAKGLGALS